MSSGLQLIHDEAADDVRHRRVKAHDVQHVGVIRVGKGQRVAGETTHDEPGNRKQCMMGHSLRDMKDKTQYMTGHTKRCQR